MCVCVGSVVEQEQAGGAEDLGGWASPHTLLMLCVLLHGDDRILELHHNTAHVDTLAKFCFRFPK